MSEHNLYLEQPSGDLSNDYEKTGIKEAEAFIDNFIDSYWKREFANGECEAMTEKLRHIDDTIKMVDFLDLEQDKADMLRVGVKFHDIGRYWQYRMISSFDDRIEGANHQVLGGEYIDALVQTGELPQSRQVSFIADIVRYHGKNLDMLDLDGESREYVELCSAIDRIQNSCIGATQYLEREKFEDAKHYKLDYQKTHPNVDEQNSEVAMRQVSNDVWDHFSEGKLFDKNELCKTYADYFLFALLIGLSCLKSDNSNISSLARESYYMKDGDGKTAIQRYQEIFADNIDEPYAGQVTEILFNSYGLS